MLIERIDAETLASARRLYESTATSLAAISRFLKVDVSTLKRYVVRRRWARGTDLSVHADGRGLLCPGIGLCPARAMVRRRLHINLERRLRAMEEAEDTLDSAADRERETRSFSSMVRAVQKLQAMDQAAAKTLNAQSNPSADEEQAPYDVEQLRREISSELDRLYQARAQDSASGPPG